MHQNLQRTLDFLNGLIELNEPDRASDSDNKWTDGATVDAHTYVGWTYDYYYKRFGRKGLDNNNIQLTSLVHPVNRNTVLSASGAVVSNFYLNAFYAGDGIMVYGEGLPSNLRSGGQSWNYLSGALDVTAHELSHGVTEFTSNLIYQGESGALNESFSDMMGTSVEFFYQPAGSGPLRADYLIGEDVVTPGGLRSMANPSQFGDPDHYSQRYTGPNDNGGVHSNSAIGNQWYYLAIEGGTNRTSGLGVTGVGSANREQIERVVYRAFTQLMPANANYSTARAVTIQAATDLYGASSAVTRAVTQAWTALGVN
jgi:thermolysin